MFHVEHPEPKQQQQKRAGKQKNLKKTGLRKQNLRMWGRFRVKL